MAINVTIKKVLNNNVIIAIHPLHDEVILIEKGIGFNKKAGDIIDTEVVEKTFLLETKHAQEQYKQLLSSLDEDFIELMNDVIYYIEQRMNNKLNEHVHIALTDHMAFAIRRMKEGMEFKNPFLLEIQSLYPEEYEIAKEIVEMIKLRLGVDLPEGEVGFIAIHIHSAVTDKELSEINKHSKLIHQLTNTIEDGLTMELDKQSIDYHRLVQHLRRAIDRVHKGDKINESNKLENMLKSEYPVCYNLAWKIIKIMQQTLRNPVDESEAIYLTIHLQRLINK